ncbi:MAG: UvrD-helicase domain-containing protein [Chloroflexi bacterium]|nr:UvrD-helicase domain-containing protein [Chloroflexota bacterium]
MQPTDEQRDAICGDDNLIVVAGAGSGKTRVLVERFLRLLKDNPNWRINSLVAITFTREAAFEMRNRLRVELERLADEDGSAQWARHLSQLDSARIDTIHGLCASALRANAAQAGIDPKFEVLDENESALLLNDIVDDVLAAIQAPLSTLFAHYDAFRIENTLKQMSLINAEYAPVPEDPEELFSFWEEEWSAVITKTRDQLLASAELAELASAGPAPEEDKLAELVAQYLRYLTRIEDEEDAETITQLMRACHDEGAVGNKGSAAAWGGRAAKKEAADSLRELRGRIKESLDEIGDAPGELDRATAEMLPLWHQLLQQVRTTYRQYKQENAQLDFDDLERLTAELLQDEPVRERYRNAEFKHLLVDEFQDTNAAQWKIIQSLADLERSGSLFVVGDPKQSIYQFRGADVSVFNEVRKKLADLDGSRELPLSQSFRSHRPLVEQFNELFAKILVRDDASPVKDYEVEFDKPMTAFREKPPAMPAIELQLLDPDERDDDGEPILGRNGRRQIRSSEEMRHWEAYEIALRIQAVIDEQRPVFDKDERQERNMDYRDVAILFQSMTNVTLYEDALKAREIPFLTIAGRGYFERQEIWDMLDLLRFLHNPADDLSLASALRSPMFAFSDDLLFALRLICDEGAEPREPLPLWRALQAAAENTVPAVADSDLPLIRHAMSTIRDLRHVAGKVTISELLRRALALTNYLAILTGLPGGDRLRGNVEKLLQLAEDSGRITLGKFTRFLVDLSAREAREGEATLEPGKAVRLMTAHASKGLEFPLVILADASWERGNWGAPTVHVDPKHGLSCSMYSAETNAYESGFAHRRNLKLLALKEAAERKRLLYVAATRAQDYLLISGAAKQGKAGKWAGRGWLKLLLPAMGISKVTQEPEQLVDFAGHNLCVRMPPSPPEQRQFRLFPSRAEPSLDAAVDAEVHPPLAPPLLKPLPAASPAHATHISATQLEDLGSSRYDPDARRRSVHARRFQSSLAAGAAGVDADRPLEIRRPSRRLIGQIAHEILQFGDFSADNELDDKLIRSIAWEHGLTERAELRRALGEIRDLLRLYRESEAFNWINSARAAGHPVYTELPFLFRTEKRVIHGVMDVLLQLSDDEWIIIDYKTSAVADGDFARHAGRYHLQLGIYAAAAREQLRLARFPQAYIHYLRANQTIRLASEDCRDELQRLNLTIGELTVPDA